MKRERAFKTGFTTGTCAQAAAKAAALMLINKKAVNNVDVETPKGVRLNLKIVGQKIGKNFAQCAVIKDAGDDPDVTDGARICAKAEYSGRKGVFVTGGEGVGIVTKAGLAVKVGEYAINPVPRKMIIKEIAPLVSKYDGMEVTISVPEGKRIAGKTFNPRLGIVGGISIIGTTGIVEPRSTDAYKRSLSLQIDILKAAGHEEVVLVLGYVGEKFCKETSGIDPDSVVKIGDHIGFMLRECAKKNIRRVLLAGHIGKMVKVANGQLDTNIRFGDNRIATIAHYAVLCQAKKEIIEEISKQVSAEAAVAVLRKHGLTRIFDMIAKKAADEINKFVNPVSSKEGLRDERRRTVKYCLSAGCILLSLDGKALSAYPKRECKRWARYI